MADIEFVSYERSSAAAGASPVGNRLQGKVELTLASLQGGPPHLETLHFLLRGPEDVGGLEPGAVRRTYPAHGAFGVETDKCVYVEFAATDLPWRYTAKIDGTQPRPWLVLVVGTPDEVVLLPGGTVVLTQTVVAGHPLNGAFRWAHVQDYGGVQVSRLMSPRALTKMTSYVAVLVPAVPVQGNMLPAGTRIPAYYAWQFTTSDVAGSFRDLALRLWALKPLPEKIGFAPLAYQTATGQATLVPELLVGGALIGRDSAAPAALLGHVREHFMHLRPRIDPTYRRDPDGRPVVHMPVYGEPWLGAGAAEPAWMRELNDDPRHRSAAGLGGWAGIEWQERIVDAASRQLAAFYTAGRRIRQLTAGLAASRSLWDSRLPDEPMHKLSVLGPAMARMATPLGDSVLAQVAASDRPLPPAAFSSAARRLLRPGTARARHAAVDALAPGPLLERMNTCRPDSRETPSGLAHVDRLLGRSLDDAIAERRGRDLTFSETAVEDAHFLNRAEAQAMEETPGPVTENRWSEASAELIANRDAQRDILDDAHAPRPVRPCEGRGADLSRLVEVLERACTPHGHDAFVIRRVLATIHGLDGQPLTPPELCLDFHIPAWKFLKEYAKDWLLPGLAQLHFVQRDAAGQPIHDANGQPIRDDTKDPVIAVKTNGYFTDAFLVGFNQQALAELRWRNVPVASGCTPLRRFWEPIKTGADLSGEDIRGIHAWGDTPLGDDSHETQEVAGAPLVLVFKTSLWRRYPETLVYLLADQNNEPHWAGVRTDPNLHIEIERDVVAFGFPAPEPILDTHWVIIEQVPRGFTFYNNVAAGQAPNGAAFAKATFAQPVRVLIKGTEFKP